MTNAKIYKVTETRTAYITVPEDFNPHEHESDRLYGIAVSDQIHDLGEGEIDHRFSLDEELVDFEGEFDQPFEQYHCYRCGTVSSTEELTSVIETKDGSSWTCTCKCGLSISSNSYDQVISDWRTLQSVIGGGSDKPFT